MKILSSWKTYVLMIVIGFTIWAGVAILDLSNLSEYNIQKDTQLPFMMIAPNTFYDEIKEWTKIVAQILTGIGGLGGSVKLLVELFHKKKKK